MLCRLAYSMAKMMDDRALVSFLSCKILFENIINADPQSEVFGISSVCNLY
jgi:hypothetical protein